MSDTSEKRALVPHISQDLVDYLKATYPLEDLMNEGKNNNDLLRLQGAYIIIEHLQANVTVDLQ
ncbi:MAG: hypothetical protein JKY49_00505 [Cohaesibacteraceae bacterium]|nr:hypothetical protein [Cohaesibacteraceae bacterium]MBL4876195.1 hypothetical protein [Cohaesibacteraceae bacterium]